MRIAHLSDLHIDSKADVIYGVNPIDNLERTVSMLEKIQDIDARIITGDISNDGENDSLMKADKILSSLNFPIYILAGNHDNVERMHNLSPYFKKMLVKDTFKIDEYLFIMLDSVWKDGGNKSSGLLPSEELNRIQSAKNYQGIITLALHHAAIETGSWLDKRMLSNRNQLKDIVKKFPNIKLVLCGHNHSPAEEQIGQCLFCTAPAVSTSFSPARKAFEEVYSPGINIIDYNSDTISLVSGKKS